MQPIRVRFAPSPTGNLHLGSLRTSLYNYMFSRSSKDGNGRFILRIEDTDQDRFIPGAVERMVREFAWLNIKPDEGPFQGGLYGPYVQSKRLALYQKYSKLLVAKGAAYPCFCSERALELMRKEALRRRQVPRYDNRCRHLTPSEIRNHMRAGDEYVIRFKLKDITEPWHDLVFGNITHNVAAFEGDPIILKRDGFPTYHLANVVDDHKMKISHVMRGSEWLTSTPKHLLLFKALGWPPPFYAHLPLLLNDDGRKLSKRRKDFSVGGLRSAGLLPEALNCFVLQMGGHFASSVKDCLDLEALAKKTFRIEKIRSHFARVDFDRLSDLNKDALRLRLDKNLDEMVAEAAKNIKAQYGCSARFEPTSIEPSFLSHILRTYFRNRLKTMNDLVHEEFSFVWLKPASDSSPTRKLVEIAKCNVELKHIVLSSFNREAGSTKMFKELKLFSKRNSLKFPHIMRELRFALTGRTVGLPVGEIVQILGYQRTKHRLNLYWP